MIQSPHSDRDTAQHRVAQAILDAISLIPGTQEVKSATPESRAHAIQTTAALKAAAVSGSLALPPGPWGMLTVIPDLLTIWRIQAQMVADIAGAFGKQASLTREQLMYCLFKHAAAQAVRDLAARLGERLLFRRATLRTLETVAQRLGVKVTQRMIATSASRWLPVLGAVGVAGYAYYDTQQVASTALTLFQQPDLEQN
ncbi:MAG TPA: hypothetical protein VL137_09395 [Polyangiaceae bacterium]|jgi:hypothetical protein|nr:hypothetical protein [Polyangiaceae bacterium]